MIGYSPTGEGELLSTGSFSFASTGLAVDASTGHLYTFYSSPPLPLRTASDAMVTSDRSLPRLESEPNIVQLASSTVT
jgi:hypothetical protein